MLLLLCWKTRGSVTSRSLFTSNISCFLKKVKCPSRSTCGQTQTPLTLLTHLSNQYPVGGYWMSYTVQGINSVQQTVKSPPLSHCIQEGGSLWVWKRIPQAVSFHSASARAAETGFTVTWLQCTVARLAVLGAIFHSRASFTSFFCLSLLAITTLLNSLLVIACSTFLGHTVLLV